MNILFIGPYRQNDEYGYSAKDYLHALISTGYNISSAPIYMSNNIDERVDDEIRSAENNYCEDFDVIIQNVLPNLFEKRKGYNIGIYYSETKNLDYSVFIDNINIMDELWVSSTSEKETLIKSGVVIPINVIPIPVNTHILDKFQNVDTLELPVKDLFTFYLIADCVDRKNIESAIVAYNREFLNNEAVLIIKTGGVSQEGLQDSIVNLKKKLRLFNNISLYQNEILITQNLEMEQMMSLHQTGDCLLVPSKGEAYCRPAIDAIYFGNSVICTKDIHTCSILQDKCIQVDSMEVPIITETPPAPHIYTGWETWNEISIIDLQKKMRETYEKGKEKNPQREWVKNNFSYESISDKIKERLCQL